MEILYNGDVNAQYYVGWKDQIAAKTAYILSLISNGVLAQAAYTGLSTGDKNAWTVTQSSYSDDLKAIPVRIRSYLSKCDQNLWSTSQTNVNRILTEKTGIDNNAMSTAIVSTMSKIYPSKLW